MGWPAACGGMAYPRRAGNIPQIAHPCGGPAGPVLYRPAGNGARISYWDAGRSGSRILRRCGRNLCPHRFRCWSIQPAAAWRSWTPWRAGSTRRTGNPGRGRMDARPILRMGSGMACLAAFRGSCTAWSARRWRCCRCRAGRIAGALGCSGVFPVLCCDSAVGDWSIRTEGWGFFLAAFPTVLRDGFCRSLRSGVARGSRLTRRSGCCGMRRCWCVIRPTGRRRREHPAPSQGRPCGCCPLLRRVFGRCKCPRLALSCSRIRRSRRGCAPRIGSFCCCSGWRRVTG